MPLRVGDKAPSFDVSSTSGKRIALSDYLGKRNVVLYFYPGDFTAMCTKETCGFRDAYEDLVSANTEVIGVSVDSDESHQAFIAKYKLRFELVSDSKRELCRLYDASTMLSRVIGKAGRVTYVIDQNGIIRAVFVGDFSAAKHVDGVRDTVRALLRA